MINNVILRSRVRIARNIKDYPFSPVLDDTGRKEIIEKAVSALSNNGYSLDKNIDNPVYALSLSEENLISREFASDKERHALLINKERQTYIMICEEDHLRIQSFADGLDLKTAGEHAIECERLLDKNVKFAYDKRLGYLTHCPTNLGSAMRASIMMFLPALTLSNRMGDVKTQLEKIGMTIRGMYGEGSAADAYMYQISNRLSLGLSEEDLLQKTEAVAKRIAQDELNARAAVFGTNTDKLTDKIMRAIGTLKYAHIISSKEFLDCYAYARLGQALGIYDIEQKSLDELLYVAMPAHIMSKYPDADDSLTRDKRRAEVIKELL